MRASTLTASRGNALFLILIAVALFAALSYAITQSGRGSGSIDKENALIASSQLTQYPAALRTAITRMVITGTAVTALTFDTADTSANGVFSTNGGGSISQTPPSSSGATIWHYISAPSATNGWFVEGIGTTAPEVIAYATGLNLATCTAINRGLGFATTAPQTQATAVTFPTGSEGLPTQAPSNAKAAGNTFSANTNQPFACYNNGSSVYVYYHTLVEQ
jgi:hypothetical protein